MVYIYLFISCWFHFSGEPRLIHYGHGLQVSCSLALPLLESHTFHPILLSLSLPLTLAFSHPESFQLILSPPSTGCSLCLDHSLFFPDSFPLMPQLLAQLLLPWGTFPNLPMSNSLSISFQSTTHLSCMASQVTSYVWGCSFFVIIFPSTVLETCKALKESLFNERQHRCYKSRKLPSSTATASEVPARRIQWPSLLDNSSSRNSRSKLIKMKLKVKNKRGTRGGSQSRQKEGLYLLETEMSLQMGWRWSVWPQSHVDTNFSKNTTCLLTQTRVYVMTFPTYYQLLNAETLRSTFFKS